MIRVGVSVGTNVSPLVFTRVSKMSLRLDRKNCDRDLSFRLKATWLKSYEIILQRQGVFGPKTSDTKASCVIR